MVQQHVWILVCYTGWRHLAVIATNDAPRQYTCFLDLTYGQSQRVEGFTVLVYLLTIFKKHLVDRTTVSYRVHG